MKAVALTLAAAVGLLGCAEKSKSDKSDKNDRTAQRDRRDTRGGTADGTGAGTGSGTAGRTGPLVAPPADPSEVAGPKVTLPEASSTLASALAPIADRVQEAMTVGCAQGTDRVAAMFRDADDGADELHRMMRDPELRAELSRALRDRTDPALAKVMSKLDTSLIGCRDAADQARKGIDQLLQPAILVPR